jgi:hypothetical protein
MAPDPIIIDRSTWKYGPNPFDHGDAVLLSIAMVGAHYDYLPSADNSVIRSSCTTYDRHPEHYYHHLVDGALFIDKRTVPDDALFTLVVSGPMPRVDLPARTIDRFTIGTKTEEKTDRHGSEYVAPTIARDRPPWCPGSLDSVSLDLYAEMWQAAGARIGVRRGPIITFDDGTSELVLDPGPITLCADQCFGPCPCSRFMERCNVGRPASPPFLGGCSGPCDACEESACDRMTIDYPAEAQQLAMLADVCPF